MTKQEYYDLLVRSAYDGTFPSIEIDATGGISCLYRGENGKKCAVGVILPDDQYRAKYDEWGGATAEMVYDQATNVDWVPEDVCKADLRDIQCAHDGVAKAWSPEEFITKINSLPVFAEVKQKETICD